MIRSCFATLLILITTNTFGQTTPKLISSPFELRQTILEDSNAALLSLPKFIPGIVLDIRYATVNNFTHKTHYRKPAAYMRRPTAEALRKVQAELSKKGLALKIYDAYRPYSVSRSLWNAAPDKRYVANPRRGSHHNRAIAVDLSIIDAHTGKELNMGTAFDSFTDTAHHSFTALPADVLANRRLLKNLMWKYGFNFVPTEWWHYHWRDKHYDLLDIPFEDIEKL